MTSLLTMLLKGFEPTAALLFRVDLIQTLRDIRDL